MRNLNGRDLVLYMGCVIIVGLPLPLITFWYPIPYPVQTGITFGGSIILFLTIKKVRGP